MVQNVLAKESEINLVIHIPVQLMVNIQNGQNSVGARILVMGGLNHEAENVHHRNTEVKLAHHLVTLWITANVIRSCVPLKYIMSQLGVKA